jgi:galactokinase
VNLIGEHTDYNEGFVLPVAIDREIIFISRIRDDKKVRLFSSNFNEIEEFLTDEIIKRLFLENIFSF